MCIREGHSFTDQPIKVLGLDLGTGIQRADVAVALIVGVDHQHVGCWRLCIRRAMRASEECRDNQGERRDLGARPKDPDCAGRLKQHAISRELQTILPYSHSAREP